MLCTGLVPLLPPALAEPRGLLSLPATRAGEEPSDHFRNQSLTKTQTRRMWVLDEKSLLAVVVQVATNAREWPPSFPPTDYFAEKTKTQDSFLLNIPQRPIFLLSSETIAKPNVVQWK